MEGNIPVPAESIRTAAVSAAESIETHREEGRKHTARDIEKSVSTVLDATAGKDGEFASIDAYAVSTVLAESSRFDSHKDAVRSYLVQYGIWS